ncbi:MAG: FAD/NAD(P)-binding oxidoreductase, partial [Candidatus Paceibacterota bacterium]
IGYKLIYKEMKHYNYIVIGAGIAGTNGAITIRKEAPEDSIVLIGEENYPVYSRVNISKVVSNAKQPNELLLKKEEQFQQQNIHRIIARVNNLNPTEKSITLDNGEILNYDKVLIATGGVARTLTQSGSNLEGVFPFQTLDDAIAVRDYIKDKKKIAIVGGGFIGIEFVELLSNLEKQVTLIIRDDWYWQGMIDKVGGNILNEYLVKRAQVYYESEIKEIRGNQMGQIVEIELTSGDIIQTEAICVGIGLELNKSFIPVELCNRGLKVNQHLMSEDENIFGAGDIVEYYDVLQEQYAGSGTWAQASIQGMIAGYNMVHSESMKEFNLIPAYCPKTSLSIAFVGQCRLNAETMQSIVIEQGERYVQVNTNSKGEIVGGVVIGQSSYMGAIRKWIVDKLKLDDIAK